LFAPAVMTVSFRVSLRLYASRLSASRSEQLLSVSDNQVSVATDSGVELLDR